MAIVNNDGSFSGKLGDLRFYKLNGQNIVATKGGPSANDVDLVLLQMRLHVGI